LDIDRVTDFVAHHIGGQIELQLGGVPVTVEIWRNEASVPASVNAATSSPPRSSLD
jgi:hypothetical protein